MTSVLSKPPTRLCCGKKHYGVQCPDGKVMCCLCFSRFEVKDLNVTEDGRPEDVCVQCALEEAEMVAKINEKKSCTP